MPTALDQQLIRVDAGGWGLTLGVDDAGTLRQVGAGPGGQLAEPVAELRWHPEALPVWGGPDPYRPPALRLTHAEGLTTTRLVVVALERSADEHGEHVVVQLADELVDLEVQVHLRTHPDSGVLEQWVELCHHQRDAIRLEDYDSFSPFLLVADDAELCQFGGSGWADEWRWSTHGLVPGTTSLASLGGLQPHLQRSPCILLSPNGPSGEHHGDVLGVSVAWGGNTRIDLDVRPAAAPGAPRELRLRAGANPLGAAYVLDPGERFATPVVAWTWSATGRAELTRRFHRWTRDRVLRDPDRPRAIVANNWEATFFDFDEARIVELIERAASLGAELFLLDDGWFGTTYPRDDDTTSLGDWDPDPAKLPGGLAPLAQAAQAAGIRFGIWAEPEMVNPRSELHERHADWVLRDRRGPRLHRHQLALDPLLAEVREFAAGVVDRTLAEDPWISYVKWDANRPITDPGSGALAADRQSNVWVDHVRATWQLMDMVVERHPDTELMLCASGGGRTDHGTLARFHEFWTSDNTDPVTRVRMQWACGHFFPASAMAAHVTRWGDRPLGFACAVALCGRFGLDLDLAALDAGQTEVVRRAVELALQIRPLVQFGDLVRLVSPVEGDDRARAALAYVDETRSDGALLVFQLEDAATTGPSIPLDWLAPERSYELTRVDLEGAGGATPLGLVSATDLIDWPLEAACTAAIWLLRHRGDAPAHDVG